MSFEMLQSKVHWVSDYPIAIFLGYLIGKNIAKTRITKVNNSPLAENKKKYDLQLSAGSLYGYQTIGVNIKF
jgi:hypothetical protein